MNNDLISREALKKALKSNCTPEICHNYGTNWCEAYYLHNDFEDLIDNAPTVELNESVIQEVLNKRCMTAVANEYLVALHGTRPQGELVKKLKDRIEENVCKYCQMNKHCELCEISRVFQIITLTAEEQEGGADMRGGNT